LTLNKRFPVCFKPFYEVGYFLGKLSVHEFHISDPVRKNKHGCYK
jgi:hypothetical protein